MSPGPQTTTAARERFALITTNASESLADFASEVEAGLSADRKTLPCRFFYDGRGSRLFEEICGLPEYYPTRSERSILEKCSEEIADGFESAPLMVELGSGSAEKTRLLIEACLSLHGELDFVPIDISRSALEGSAQTLMALHPKLEVTAIEAEYGPGLRLAEKVAGERHRPQLILWLGSSVGNLNRDDAADFLSEVRGSMRNEDRLLMGVDLRKDPQTLESAYDDARGVTAAFNLNLLARINRELGGAFDLDAFAHRAVYREDVGRVEMHLVSRCDQRVPIRGIDREIAFSAGETIHTENSYKYSWEEIGSLADAAGLGWCGRWTDPGGLFSLNLLAPPGAGEAG